MITLIVGTPDSGKSLLAESAALKISGNRPRFYIATMIPFGEAGEQRVRKHRDMREGKGFITLEWPDKITKRLEGQPELTGAVVLLECMANLVGNEMHSAENKGISTEELTELILSSIKALGERAEHLIVVTNEFPQEDAAYDEDTRLYVRLMKDVNRELEQLSDTVWILRNGEWHSYENH